MDEEEPTDEELVRRSKLGNTRAFDELVTRHRRRIFALVYQMLGSADEAMDVAQEVFIRAWQSLEGFDGRHAFSTWLHRIATNRAIDICRMRARRPQGEWSETPDGIDVASRTTPSTPERPGDSIDRAEVQRRIDAALATLSPDHRAVLVLREIEDLSYEEIAERVGCSHGTVMSRLFHARRKMQLELRDFYERL